MSTCQILQSRYDFNGVQHHRCLTWLSQRARTGSLGLVLLWPHGKVQYCQNCGTVDSKVQLGNQPSGLLWPVAQLHNPNDQATSCCYYKFAAMLRKFLSNSTSDRLIVRNSAAITVTLDNSNTPNATISSQFNLTGRGAPNICIHGYTSAGPCKATRHHSSQLSSDLSHPCSSQHGDPASIAPAL